MKKKFLAAVLGGLLMLLPFASCGTVGEPASDSNGDDVPIICIVTFKTEDGDVKKEVSKGEALTDVPLLPSETGYTYAWSVTDFSCIESNMTVTMTKTANEYTITYDLEGLDDEITISKISQTVEFDEAFTLETPTRDCYNFEGWVDEDGNLVESGVYNYTKDLTLKAVWTEDGKWSERA